MPKVPQVLAEGGTIGTTSPPRMPLGQGTDLSGLSTFAHGIQEAARGYGHAQEVARREAAVVAKQMATLEAENALNEAQRTFADRHIAIGMDPSITPQKYSQAVDNALRATQQGYEKGLTSPDSKYMFAKGFGDFSRAKSIEGKYEAVERGKSFVRAGTTLANREDINLAVNAPDGPPDNPGLYRDAAVQRIEDRTGNLLATKIISGTEADNMRADNMAAIAEGRVVKSWDNIKTRSITAHQLRNGLIPELTVQKQRQLLDNLATKEREERATRKEEHKAFLDEQEQKAERLLTDAVRNRKWDLARHILQTHGDFFKGPRYEHWSDTIVNRELKSGPSDPDTRKQAQLETWSVTNDPAIVKEFVDNAYRVGMLDNEDHKTFVTHLVARMRAKTEGDPSLARRHAQVESNLKEGLRLTGPGAAIINLNAQTVFSMAQEDLSRNSSYFKVQGRRGNDEDPFDWEERRKAFYFAQVGSIAGQRVSTLRTLARDGNGVPFTLTDNAKADAQAVMARRSTFKTDADFDEARGVVMEYHNLNQEMRRLRGLSTGGVPPPIPNAPPAPPTPTAPAGAAAPTSPQTPKTYNRPPAKKE